MNEKPVLTLRRDRRPIATVVRIAGGGRVVSDEDLLAPLVERPGRTRPAASTSRRNPTRRAFRPGASITPQADTAPASDGNATPCRTNDPDLWFSDDAADIASAKRACTGCPRLAACLEGSLDRDEPFGIWGGLTAKERRRVLTRNSRRLPAAASA